MSTANLQAEVQVRIDALVYPVPTTELLQNAVDTVGLDLDLTNIISVLNSSTAAITSSTPDDDVTALNATSIALGVTSKGGGGGLPINSMLEINVRDDLYIAPDSTEWLQTGVIETDVANYPEATANLFIESTTYSGTSFSVAAQDTSPIGITWDGSHLWVVGASSDTIYQYTSTGTYTGVSFSVASQDTNPSGVTWDGNYLWVVGSSSDSTYQYSPDGTYTGTSFSVAAQETSPTGITWDGNHLWVVGSSTLRAYQYTSTGTYTGVNFSVSAQDANPNDITWDGNYFWVTGTSNNAVFKYTRVGAYTGVSFSVAAQDATPAGVTWDGNYFWVTGLSSDTAYKYTPAGYEYVGALSPTTGAAGLPNFTRVK